MMLNPLIIDDQKRFVADIEAAMSKSKNSSCIEAILALCEQHKIEPEILKGFLPQTIKDILEAEGREYNLLPKKQRLPL